MCLSRTKGGETKKRYLNTGRKKKKGVVWPEKGGEGVACSSRGEGKEKESMGNQEKSGWMVGITKAKSKK